MKSQKISSKIQNGFFRSREDNFRKIKWCETDMNAILCFVLLNKIMLIQKKKPRKTFFLFQNNLIYLSQKSVLLKSQIKEPCTSIFEKNYTFVLIIYHQVDHVHR